MYCFASSKCEMLLEDWISSKLISVFSGGSFGEVSSCIQKTE